VLCPTVDTTSFGDPENLKFHSNVVLVPSVSHVEKLLSQAGQDAVMIYVLGNVDKVVSNMKMFEPPIINFVTIYS
jgi:hypothetical protein